jgi:hypothetical protein
VDRRPRRDPARSARKWLARNGYRRLVGGSAPRRSRPPLPLLALFLGMLARTGGVSLWTPIHSSDSQTCRTTAFPANQHSWTGRNAERFASRTTVRTDEAIAPARLFEIFGAGSIVREKPLKLRQRLRRRQCRMLVDVHQNRRDCLHSRTSLTDKRASTVGAYRQSTARPDHRRTQHIALVCVNRIGKP